jgi:hypothetical protein
MTLANMRKNGDSRPDHVRRATSGAVALRRFQDAVTANPHARPRPSMALSATSEAGFPLFADGKVIGAIGCTLSEDLLACQTSAVSVEQQKATAVTTQRDFHLMCPVRVERRRTKGWRIPENTIYVGRGTMLGCPFGLDD